MAGQGGASRPSAARAASSSSLADRRGAEDAIQLAESGGEDSSEGAPAPAARPEVRLLRL